MATQQRRQRFIRNPKTNAEFVRSKQQSEAMATNQPIMLEPGLFNPNAFAGGESPQRTPPKYRPRSSFINTAEDRKLAQQGLTQAGLSSSAYAEKLKYSREAQQFSKDIEDQRRASDPRTYGEPGQTFTKQESYDKRWENMLYKWKNNGLLRRATNAPGLEQYSSAASFGTDKGFIDEFGNSVADKQVRAAPGTFRGRTYYDKLYNTYTDDTGTYAEFESGAKYRRPDFQGTTSPRGGVATGTDKKEEVEKKVPPNARAFTASLPVVPPQAPARPPAAPSPAAQPPSLQGQPPQPPPPAGPAPTVRAPTPQPQLQPQQVPPYKDLPQPPFPTGATPPGPRPPSPLQPPQQQQFAGQQGGGPGMLYLRGQRQQPPAQNRLLQTLMEAPENFNRLQQYFGGDITNFLTGPRNKKRRGLYDQSLTGGGY